MKANENDRYSWIQLSLSLICDHQYALASKLYDQKQNFPNLGIMENMIFSLLQIEQLGNLDMGIPIFICYLYYRNKFVALNSLSKAILLAKGSWLEGRLNFLYGIAMRLIYLFT
jgi:hypothetical protein